MSAPLRFLALALVGWAGLRAATVGIVPGAEILAASGAARAQELPPIVPTEFPPLDPVAPAAIPLHAGTGFPQVVHYPVYLPVPRGAPAPGQPYYPAGFAGSSVPAAAASAAFPLMAEPEPLFYAPIPQLDDWPLSRIASASAGARSGTPVPAAHPPAPRLDRVQLSAWALLRGPPGNASLASGGTLGGSQAGARLSVALDPRIALSLRSYAPVGTARTAGELAAGVRLTPLPSIPVSITAERRQAIGKSDGQALGRSAFALFAEGGLYQQKLPLQFSLDAYLQAGVVGARSRDLFADGGFTVTRPFLDRFSAGLGVWGGAQPGIYRVDAGPRLTMRLKRRMRIDLDYRQRIAGEAQPGSGPALTLAADF